MKTLPIYILGLLILAGSILLLISPASSADLSVISVETPSLFKYDFIICFKNNFFMNFRRIFTLLIRLFLLFINIAILKV